ncbi:MAG: fluoride efflux transporter CrcB [Verrucomicrobiota bacterium]
MKLILCIGIGGFIGAICRHFLAGAVDRWQTLSGFPWGIFVANIVGCLLIGVFLGYSLHIKTVSEEARLLFVTGFLGSLTTFSTFSLQTLELFRNDQTGLALANIGASVVVGLLAVWLGFGLMSWFRS